MTSRASTVPFLAGSLLGAAGALLLLQMLLPPAEGTTAMSLPGIPDPPVVAPAADGKLRIIAFGAHPDDCEVLAGGTAARWAALGHHVKFVSVSNGDIGHHRIAGGPLARRRRAEVEECARILGVTTQVLDHHDGEIEPTLEVRRELVRLIREWKADLVMTHRPNDYHPDHRYASILVQDSAFMVIVPSFCPEVQALRKNPVFLYFADSFQKPVPFQPDVVVAIDDAIEKKLDAMAAIESQFLEWQPWLDGIPDQVPGEKAARREWVARRYAEWLGAVAEPIRSRLMARYGEEKGRAVRYAEAFEVCEYGRRPDAAELDRMFPR